LRYTRYGDANLDGTVNTTDFNLLASNFGATNLKHWFQGDFNYDGAVNTTDFNLLAGNFGQSVPDGAVALGAIVPEPGMTSVVVGAVLLGLRRRVRRIV